MREVNAALLGVRHPHSAAHLRTLQQLPEVKAIHLWDEDGAALQALEKSQGEKIVATHTELDALLARDDIFFAITALRNDLSPAICIRALQAGLHLMAEKPIGRTAADVQRVVEAARHAGKRLGVCYQNRRNPVVCQMRDLMAQGLLGKLMSVEMRMITTAVRFRDPGHWLFSHEKAGGGMLSWLGCHYIDLMRYITGDEIVSVSAETATRSGEAIDVEDVAALSLRLASGAVGSLHVGYILALRGGGYFNKQGYDTYAGFNGQAGRMYWRASGAPSHLYVETSHEEWRDAPIRELAYTLGESPAYGGTYGEAFIRAFIQAAEDGGSVPASGADALQVARVVDAAYESNRRGRRVAVEAPVQDT